MMLTAFIVHCTGMLKRDKEDAHALANVRNDFFVVADLASSSTDRHKPDATSSQSSSSASRKSKGVSFDDQAGEIFEAAENSSKVKAMRYSVVGPVEDLSEQVSEPDSDDDSTTGSEDERETMSHALSLPAKLQGYSWDPLLSDGSDDEAFDMMGSSFHSDGSKMRCPSSVPSSFNRHSSFDV